MGTSRNAKEFAAKFDKSARSMPQVKERAARTVAVAAEREFNLGLMRVGVIPGSSRMPRRKVGSLQAGVPVKAQHAVGKTDRSSILVTYKGPVHWIEGGTKPHAILSQKAGGSRRSRVRRGEMYGKPGDGEGDFDVKPENWWLKTPRGPRAWVQHPGSRPRPFFGGVKRAVYRRTPEVYRKAVHNELVRVFK